MNPPRLDFKRLDVRALLARGHEPLAAIRQGIATLTAGQGLVVIAPFLPSPLIELLHSEGFDSRVEPGGGGDWIVYFWRQSLVD